MNANSQRKGKWLFGASAVFAKAGRFRCAKFVPESNVFTPFELSLSEKQIPRFVGNVSS